MDGLMVACVGTSRVATRLMRRTMGTRPFWVGHAHMRGRRKTKNRKNKSSHSKMAGDLAPIHVA